MSAARVTAASSLSSNMGTSIMCNQYLYFSIIHKSKPYGINIIVTFTRSSCSDYLAIYLVSNAKKAKILACHVILVAPLGIIWGFFFWTRNWFGLCVKIIVIVHHAGNSAQISFSTVKSVLSMY
jgi:hypothetical protein